MYSDVAMGVNKSYFERLIDEMKAKRGVTQDVELTADDLKELAEQFKDVYKKEKGEDFPTDPKEQLIGAIKAVFASWDNPRANVYRRDNDIPYSWGTAVNVQEMVFGNWSDNSGSGVAFTRDPSTGENAFYAEVLMNAQGEDVVSGARTPMKIEEIKKTLPNIYEELLEIAHKLEDHYCDMQDMEFTIEDGKLFMLQCRNGKRTARAAIKIAVDLVNEGKTTKEKALLAIDPRNLDTLLHGSFDPKALKAAEADGKLIGQGLPAAPGAASGKIVFTAEESKEWAAKGEKVVLVRRETSPEDIEGMKSAQGILTARGGMTSHAAVVARGMGSCCVAGCSEIVMDEDNKTFQLGGHTYHEGDVISFDGNTGKIYDGALPIKEGSIEDKDFATIMEWADEARALEVRTNADTPTDAQTAVQLGAEGIGLCRTEHMFFNPDRIPKIRKMILSDTTQEREAALNELIPFQKGDFKGLYKAMAGRPVTIRFLDPPLHEFVPNTEPEIKAMADEMGLTVEEVKRRCDDLKEFNPMMGHRGCRLSVTFPEIARMQTRAVLEAAIEVHEEDGYDIEPNIMIPLVGDVKELRFVKKEIVATAEKVKAEKHSDIKYHIGTMIEIPRAALMADQIAEEAEFFSFGTNDLTQMTFGFSRDDAGKFLQDYYKSKIYEQDPFAHLDQNGVGQLIEIAVEKGRKTRPDIKLGICGEHGGDPASIEFCNRVGLNYVSCSPFRVPIARLAAAQAQIKLEREQKKG